MKNDTVKAVAKVAEKFVDGAFDCFKEHKKGRNAVALEQAKTQHDAVVGGLVIFGIGVALYGGHLLLNKARDIIENGGKVKAEVAFGKAHANFELEGKRK